jgi:hypothetical protein
MRGRIALLKRCARSPLKTIAVWSRSRGTFGVRARLRAAFGMRVKRVFKMPMDVRMDV